MLFHNYDIQDEYLRQYKLNAPLKLPIVPLREIHFNSNNGFGIYLCETEDEETFVIKGVFVNGLIPGQTYQIQGVIQEYKGERQLFVEKWFNIQPVNKKGIISYLQSLQGLKNKANDIYDVFGQESIKVLLEDPYRVSTAVRGIGKKSVEKWKIQLDKMEESHYILAVLYGYGLTVKETKKLLKDYGISLIEKIKNNPYFLAKEVRGFSFLKCDKIAREVGFDMNSSFRKEEAILYTLQQLTSFGHVFIKTDALVRASVLNLNITMPKRDMYKLLSEKTEEEEVDYYLDGLKFVVNYYTLRNLNRRDSYTLISFNAEDVESNLLELRDKSALTIEDNGVYLNKFYNAEINIAKKVQEINNERLFSGSFDLKKELDKYLNENNIALADKQYEAVITIAKSAGGFFVLIGNAGSGKTFVLKIILELLKRQYRASHGNMELGLYAPTGKASKVASRATGIECTTIHRGLEFTVNSDGVGFVFNKSNPLQKNVVAVDESSMLDTMLADSLLEAIRIGTKVIFMGDTKQLSSVGAGNVLHDLIESKRVTVIELDVPQRQKENSGIINNANNIIEHNEVVSSGTTKDFYTLYRKTPNDILKAVSGSVKNLIANRGYSFDDIQILTPQKNGIIGTHYLNYYFQQMFNKPKVEQMLVLNKIFDFTDSNGNKEICKLYFVKNDKVIHLKNNYDVNWFSKEPNGEYKLIPDVLGITNGESGIVEEVIIKTEDDITYNQLVVKYDIGYVIYDKFDELEHAYALTIHKSQGSQWKALLLVMSDAINPMMLVNNIIYTGVTRAEEFCACIGSRRAFMTAITNEKAVGRNTTLNVRLNQVYLDY